MNIATISAKYQIVVPKKIRDQLHLKPGQQFIFVTKGDCLELVPKRSLEDLRGILKNVNTDNIRDRDKE